MDVRVYVDVKLGDGMDGGALLRGILQGLGATVYQRTRAASCPRRRTRSRSRTGRARAREYLVRHDLATTSRKRKHTPKAFEAKPLRAADLPGLDDPRFRSVLKSDAESSSAAGSAAGSLSAFHRLAPWSAVSRAGTELREQQRQSSEAPTQPQPTPGAPAPPDADDGAPAPAAAAPPPSTAPAASCGPRAAAHLLLSRDRYWDDDAAREDSARRALGAPRRGQRPRRERGRQPHRAPRRLAEASPSPSSGASATGAPRPPRPTTATTPARRRSGPGSGAASSSRRRRVRSPPRRRRAATPHRPEPEIIVIDDTPVPEKVAVDAAPPPPEDAEPESAPTPDSVGDAVAPMPVGDVERRLFGAARRGGAREPVVISASGVDEDVRGALREVSKRIATHLVVAAKPPAARAPRTLKVLFALARGGCAIVTPAWAFASLDDETWAPPDAYLAGYGPPRPKKPNTLAGVEVHVVANALGPAEPPHSALQALAPAALRALHRNGHVLRVRWLFDAIEHQDPARPQATYRVPA
ncbi:hypothetical protein JL720_11614 [Aureococcus anophagefferens]|nr:hypothetical protein JL720_11614 [Aureococcus anophagefferens]